MPKACEEYDRLMEKYISAVKAYSTAMSRATGRSGVEFELVRLRIDETHQACEEARRLVEDHQREHG